TVSLLQDHKRRGLSRRKLEKCSPLRPGTATPAKKRFFAVVPQGICHRFATGILSPPVWRAKGTVLATRQEEKTGARRGRGTPPCLASHRSRRSTLRPEQSNTPSAGPAPQPSSSTAFCQRRRRWATITP